MKASKPVFYTFLLSALAIAVPTFVLRTPYVPSISLPSLSAPYSSAPVSISGSGHYYTAGDYTVENNDWGKGALTINRDYTQKITFNKDNLQRDLAMEWAYPDVQGAKQVYGFPEVIWGNKFGYLGTLSHTNQIRNIADLSVNYGVEIGGQTDNFSVGIEIWTTDKPWTAPGAALIHEIMVKVHGWQDGPGILYSDADLTAIQAVHKHPNGHTFITFNTTADKLSGTLNVSKLLNSLVAQGLISDKEYVSGIELGAEIKQGAGTFRINRFAVTESLNSKHD